VTSWCMSGAASFGHLCIRWHGGFPWLRLGQGQAGGGRGWCDEHVEELNSSPGVWAENDQLRCGSLDDDDCG